MQYVEEIEVKGSMSELNDVEIEQQQRPKRVMKIAEIRHHRTFRYFAKS